MAMIPGILPCRPLAHACVEQELIPALKQSASAFPKVHAVWGHLWDDLGLAQAGQPRGQLTSKRLNKLGEVLIQYIYSMLCRFSSTGHNKGIHAVRHSLAAHSA